MMHNELIYYWRKQNRQCNQLIDFFFLEVERLKSARIFLLLCIPQFFLKGGGSNCLWNCRLSLKYLLDI
jgi:hypothetical protein